MQRMADDERIFEKFKRGTVFLYEHNGVKTPFLVYGPDRLNFGALGTFYLNRRKVLRKPFWLNELKNAEIIAHVTDLTEFVFWIFDERGKEAYGILNEIFDKARKTGGEISI